jgi:hypothetical protein
MFMFTPWLVYSEYPRRKTINWFYIVKKVLISAMLLIALYLINSEYIQPWIHMAGSITALELILRLMLPTTISLILIFYLVFDNMCNFFAELTRLDHR